MVNYVKKKEINELLFFEVEKKLPMSSYLAERSHLINSVATSLSRSVLVWEDPSV